MAEVTHVGFVKRGGLKANNVIDGTFYSLREKKRVNNPRSGSDFQNLLTVVHQFRLVGCRVLILQRIFS